MPGLGDMTFATYEGAMLKFKGDLLGCKTLDPFFPWVHLPSEDMGQSEKLCSLNTPQARSSQLLCEVVFLVLIDANCSFFAFTCSGAYFLQASNGILDGATETQRSACSLVSQKRKFC